MTPSSPPESLKIGLIKHRFVNFGGGSERYNWGLVEQLRSRGHRIHVFAARWDRAAEDCGLVMHRIPVLFARSFLGQLSFAVSCRKATARERCDILFSAERTLHQDICRAGGGCHREWLRQRRRYSTLVKSVSFAVNPLHLTLLGLERRTFHPANTRYVIANSHRGKEEIVHHYGFPAERIAVVHNGVDCQQFSPSDQRRAAHDFVLLFVGSGFERKGLRFCIQALSELPSTVRLVVAGKGDRRPYEQLAEHLGVRSRLEFLGATAGMREVYAQGDVLVHPAIYEPFSNACLEAMASGLPVVTSKMNGAAEIIAPGVNGQVVAEPDDPVALANAIRSFLDRAVLSEASAQARTTAERLPLALNVERTLEVFRKVQLQASSNSHYGQNPPS